ncbi:unnamed protein product [Arctogadus glacialis]
MFQQQQQQWPPGVCQAVAAAPVFMGTEELGDEALWISEHLLIPPGSSGVCQDPHHHPPPPHPRDPDPPTPPPESIPTSPMAVVDTTPVPSAHPAVPTAALPPCLMTSSQRRGLRLSMADAPPTRPVDDDFIQSLHRCCGSTSLLMASQSLEEERTGLEPGS